MTVCGSNVLFYIIDDHTSTVKIKEERAAKSKKGKSGPKATIKMETDRSMFARGMDDGFNDMDDFMWFNIIYLNFFQVAIEYFYTYTKHLDMFTINH